MVGYKSTHVYSVVYSHILRQEFVNIEGENKRRENEGGLARSLIISSVSGRDLRRHAEQRPLTCKTCSKACVSIYIKTSNELLAAIFDHINFKEVFLILWNFVLLQVMYNCFHNYLPVYSISLTLCNLAVEFSRFVMAGNQVPSSRRYPCNYSPTHGDDPANRQRQ